MSSDTVFTWTIENFSCLKEESLQSPSFESHSSKWELRIWPADNEGYIDLCLQNLDSSGLTLDIAISFIDSEGSPLVWRQKKNCCFTVGFCAPDAKKSTRKTGDGYFRIPAPYSKNKTDVKRIRVDEFAVTKRDDFGSVKSQFLTDVNLTVECRMWFNGNKLLQPEKFFALTRFEPTPIKQKKRFVLNVYGVSSLTSSFNLEHVEPMDGTGSTNGNFLKLRLCLNQQEQFLFGVTPSLYQIEAHFKISLLEVSGKMIRYADIQFDLNEKHHMEMFDTNITKLMLMCFRDKFLSNDMLSLVFECTLFYKISFSSSLPENEYIINNTQPILMHCRTPDTNLSTEEAEIESTNSLDPPNNVNQVLQQMYEEGFMSDFCLRVQDKTFRVHKTILGARSSVFKAMFTADMKEKDSDHVDIPDVDADTIQRMLKFVYLDEVDKNMQWESACSLYTAADKYALSLLKQRCANLLMSGLTASNVCGVLIIADTHHDQDLKNTVLDFILENDKEIVDTDAWKKFAEEHSLLAFETLQKLYVKKMDLQ